MNTLSIATCNVRGLREDKKRHGVFNWLRKTNCDIIFLQETHGHHVKDSFKWSKEWSGQSIWSRGSSHSRGVSVLFNRNVKYDIRNKIVDPNGRYIIFDLYLGEQNYRFINIYAPNSEYERVCFFNNMISWIDPDIETFIAGDYNCVLNSDIDRMNCTGKNDVGQVDLKNIMNMFCLEDIFRRRWPDRKCFSWRCGDKASRLDYWLISESLDNQTDSVEYLPCTFSDHGFVKLNFRINETPHGKGVWKMNSKTIESKLFRNTFTSWWEHFKTKKSEYSNTQTWWDIGKKKIKEIAIWCSCKLKEENDMEIRLYEEKLQWLEQDPVHNFKFIDDIKCKLKKMYEDKGQGAKVRSRLNWFEYGEKPTKYFHNLEKQNAKNKAWESILDKDGELISGTKNVQKVQVDFYKTLYKSEGICTEKCDPFLSSIDRVLSDEIKCELDQEICLHELTVALKQMAMNKSPGPDGIVVEFYKMYWNILGTELLEVFHESVRSETLPYSQYLAVIILLYKKGQRENIKNWRPISLLNTDAKLYSKVLAERLKKALPAIIHTDQSGCIPGRFIGQNVRLIEDIIECKDGDEVLLFIDQEKAFDRVEWNWLFKVLDTFNFGDKFKNYVKILYNNMKSSILTNGTLSEYFEVTRGIRQGDSLSALLYVVQSEPLAEYIRKSSDIRGIEIKGVDNCIHSVKCSQYVDDTTVFLNDVSEIDKCVKILEDFGLASGAKLNKDKTVGIVMNKNVIKQYSGGIKLTDENVKALGVPVGKFKSKDAHWNKIIEKLRKHLLIWKARNLSYTGKVHIIKSIGLSNILYSSNLITLEEKYIKEIEHILWNFLWDDRKITVPKNVVSLPRFKGGLNMTNVQTMLKAQKIKWIIRILSCTDEMWKVLPLKYITCLDKKYGIDFFLLRIDDCNDIIKDCKIPDFYKTCILSFQELGVKGKVRSPHDNEIIWGNANCKFNGKALFFSHWSTCGIQYISDIITNGIVQENMIYTRLHRKAGFFFELRTVKQAIPDEWKEKVQRNEKIKSCSSDTILNTKYRLPSGKEKCLRDLTSKDIYNILMSTNTPHIRSKQYWECKLNKEIDFNVWFQINFVNKITPRKCLDFNWKIFYGQVNTENKMKYMKLSDGLCKLCKKEGENVEHILLNCGDNYQCWNMINDFVQKICNDVMICRNEILSGVLKKGNMYEIVNMILSVTRWIIWKRRCINRYENEYIDVKRLKIWICTEIIQHCQIVIKNQIYEDGIKMLITEVKRYMNRC